MVTSSAGKPTVSSTITIVIKPACGIPAAPIEAAVAVTLHHKTKIKMHQIIKISNLIFFFSPDSNDVSKCKRDVAQLSNEQSGNSFIKRSSYLEVNENS